MSVLDAETTAEAVVEEMLSAVVADRAVLEGRDYVVPDDVRRVAAPALAHRLVLTPEVTVQGTDRRAIIDSVLEDVEVPAMASPSGSSSPSGEQ